ncbi:MAG: ATP-dependent sacrificial sulfur transferase LarE [Clostridia bacterium]|nr:ATP-dependent sacrificial sulfur transferase LarE [Clostridia bacterium]
MEELLTKQQKLISELKEQGSIAVAFSGGVDSALLLKTAHDALGDNAVAFTLATDFFPDKETEEAVSFCRRYGIKHELIYEDILSVHGIKSNPVNRCYFCKKHMFRLLKVRAAALGIKYVAEGSNADDAGDFRPGMKAIEELGIKSPLKSAGLTKDDIRALANKAGLSVWDKPSAACLASRFIYGEELTKERLSSVEKAEEMIRSYGVRQLRVRVHGDLARIETGKEDIKKLTVPDVSESICRYLKDFGFLYVTLDLGGYRTGSMNESIKK